MKPRLWKQTGLFCWGVVFGVELGLDWVWIGFALGLDRVRIGFALGLDWVWIGFAFFVFFWTIVIVSPYHSKCYSQLARLKIGFAWYKRVLSAIEGFSWFAQGGQNIKCEMKNVKLGLVGFGLGSDWVWIGFGLGSDWVWIGFGLGLDWV